MFLIYIVFKSVIGLQTSSFSTLVSSGFSLYTGIIHQSEGPLSPITSVSYSFVVFFCRAYSYGSFRFNFASALRRAFAFGSESILVVPSRIMCSWL